MSLVMALGLISLALDNHVIKIAYVDHGNYPGGGFTYQVAQNTSKLSISTASGITMFLMDFLTLAIQVG
jgi:hypothetical protein